jgi:hypothetical protein
MSFLHWFKRKSESTQSQAGLSLAGKLATDQANTSEIVSANSRQETRPGTPPDEQRPGDLQSLPQNMAVASEPATSEPNAPSTAPHVSVPIGAFYAKLPTHLLTPKKPDLARSVQIAEEDLLLDQETQEATLPLSILSLSCPDIFVRAVGGSDDVPVTFSLNRPKELEREIRLRLQPILSDFPPNLEPPSIHTLIGTQAEIVLSLDMIQPQLALGRVVVPAETFREALPSELKPYFESIDPAEEIPIPLQEVFSRLPPEAIKLREDQEIDRPQETIPTPFGPHAEEDAKRFSQTLAESTPPANESLQTKDEPPKVAVQSDSERLQAIFMTDEPLDLATTIQKVAELPGLRSCILSTTDGLKLAGNLGDPGWEKAISAVLPELFQRTRSTLEELRAGPLETITLYCGLHQLSTFVQGKLCLTVLHDNRPFKPGVREKIQAVIRELAALSAPEKPL